MNPVCITSYTYLIKSVVVVVFMRQCLNAIEFHLLITAVALHLNEMTWKIKQKHWASNESLIYRCIIFSLKNAKTSKRERDRDLMMSMISKKHSYPYNPTVNYKFCIDLPGLYNETEHPCRTKAYGRLNPESSSQEPFRSVCGLSSVNHCSKGQPARCLSPSKYKIELAT